MSPALPRVPLPRAVVFDLDGTLVDSVADVADALATVLREAGIHPLSEDEVRGLMGHGAPGLLRGALRLRRCDSGEAAWMTRRFLDRYAAAPAVHSAAYPGAVEAVAALAAAGIPVGICTNKAAWTARAVLRACIAMLGAAPEDTVYLGDHHVDIATARAAGVRVLAVPFGYGDIAGLKPDGIVADYAALPGMLGLVGAG